MGTLLLLLAAVVAVGGAVAGIRTVVVRSKASVVAANQVVPGHPTRAPESWAGSHDVEARLHRRLRDAMTALRANEHFDDDGDLLDVRVDLEQQALALDDRLVAVSALSSASRSDALAQVADVVGLIEQTVAELAARSVAEARPMVEAALAKVRERSTLLDQVRAQLDQMPEPEPEPELETGPTAQPGTGSTPG